MRPNERLLLAVQLEPKGGAMPLSQPITAEHNDQLNHDLAIRDKELAQQKFEQNYVPIPPKPNQKSTREILLRQAKEHTPQPLSFETGDLLQRLETEHEQAQRRIKARFALTKMGQAGFKKPAFGSTAYKEYCRKGWISPEETEADAIMREIRSIRTGQKRPALWGKFNNSNHVMRNFTITKNTPVRWGREEPIPSDQYAPKMATTAARDDRLTPNAKALLQIIHARCGKDGVTETTKGTLASIMQRSTRSIQRYLTDLQQFGYILRISRQNDDNWYLGLRIWVTEKTKPYYESFDRVFEGFEKFLGIDTSSASRQKIVVPYDLDNGEPLDDDGTFIRQNRRKQGRSQLSSKNGTSIINKGNNWSINTS